MVKTGFGVDVHGFTNGSGLTLGGVAIPYDKTIAGHSDGDVVIHAIVDALLGASALGDIGAHFPSSDPQWQGVSSRLFLQACREIVTGVHARVDHVDCTVILEEPRLAPFIGEMRRLVAADLGIDPEQVSIKATTTDRLGVIGRGDGIAAMAVVTVTTPEEPGRPEVRESRPA